jgi:hypothetical protein
VAAWIEPIITPVCTAAIHILVRLGISTINLRKGMSVLKRLWVLGVITLKIHTYRLTSVGRVLCFIVEIIHVHFVLLSKWRSLKRSQNEFERPPLTQVHSWLIMGLQVS